MGGLAAAGLFLVVSAIVGALASLLANGNLALSNRVVAIINSSIATDSTRLEVARVSGTLFRGAVLERPRLVVRTPEGEVTWASARRIRIDYNLYGVLFSRYRDLNAVIDSPVVRLVRDRTGRLVVPRFRSRPTRDRGTNTTRVSIAAHNGFFSVDWEGIRFREVEGRALLTAAPGQSILQIQQISAYPDSAGRSGGRVQANGVMTVAGASLRVDPLEATYGRSRVRARIEWDLENGRATEGLMTLAPLRLEDVSRFTPARGAEGTLRGEMTFTGIPTDGEATACLVGEVEGEPLDTLAVTAALKPRSIDFSGLKLRVRGAEVTGGGIYHSGGLVDAGLTFRGIDPSSIPWWKEPEGMPTGRLAGRTHVIFKPTRPRASITAAVELEESRFGRLAVRQGLLHIATRPDGSALLDSGWVDVPGGRLTGRASLDRHQTLDARVLAVIENLGAMDSLIAPVAAASGKGRITAELSGSMRAPDFTAHALLWQGRLDNGIGFDTLRAESRGRLDRSGSRAEFTARGLDLNERPLGDAVAAVTFGERIVIERYVQRSGDSTLTFRGTITPGDRETVALLDSLALDAGGIRFQNLEPVRLTMAGGHVQADALALDTRPGRVDIAFDWDLRRNRIDARGAIRGFELTRIPRSGSGADSLRGEVRGQFLASGPLRDPDLSLAFEVARPGLGGIVGDSAAVALDYTPGVLRIDRARWSASDGRVDLAGTVRAPVALGSWLHAFGTKDKSWAKSASLALDLRVDSLDLARIAPADTSLRTLGGSATLTARMTGTAEDPVVAIRGSSPRVVYQGLEAAITGAELAYADRKLRITRFDISQAGSISSVTGDVPMDFSFFAKERLLRDRPLHLTVRATDADFKIASVLSPYIAVSSGRVSVMAGVTGTPRTPAIQGTVRLRDGKVRLAGRDEVVDRIELEGTFDQNQLTVSRMVGFQGAKGRLSGSGTWQWGGLAPSEMVPIAAGPAGRYQFTVKAEEFTTSDRETYLFRLNGTFTIAPGRTAGGRQIPNIQGSAVLSKGNLTLDLSQRSTEEVAFPFYYDIHVDAPGNLFYRTVDSEVELQGALRLLNEGQGNLALGTMSVRKGRYYLFTREIRNLSGDFIFNSLERTDPELAVDGETTVTAETGDPIVIKVSLSGRASRPIVHLWSDNSNYSQADLWRHLTYGQILGDTPTGTGTSSGGLAVPIQAYLFRNAERWLSESGWIDTFDLRTGARSGTTSPSSESQQTASSSLSIGVIGAGKYVTRDLYLNYSRDFSGVGEEQMSAEYRFSRYILLRGQRAQRRTTSTDPNAHGEEYNLDLKVRLEY